MSLSECEFEFVSKKGFLLICMWDSVTPAPGDGEGENNALELDDLLDDALVHDLQQIMSLMDDDGDDDGQGQGQDKYGGRGGQSPLPHPPHALIASSGGGVVSSSTWGAPLALSLPLAASSPLPVPSDASAAASGVTATTATTSTTTSIVLEVQVLLPVTVSVRVCQCV